MDTFEKTGKKLDGFFETAAEKSKNLFDRVTDSTGKVAKASVEVAKKTADATKVGVQKAMKAASDFVGQPPEGEKKESDKE